MSEYDEQLTVMEYAHGYGGNLDSRLKMLHPVENTKGGGRGPAGFQYVAGVPDMFLPIAVNPFHGLYIELKANGGKVSAKQKAWQKQLRKEGYASEIVFGADDAIELIRQYLAGNLPPF